MAKEPAGLETDITRTQVIVSIGQLPSGRWTAAIRIAPANNAVNTHGIGRFVKGSFESPTDAIAAAHRLTANLYKPEYFSPAHHHPIVVTARRPGRRDGDTR